RQRRPAPWAPAARGPAWRQGRTTLARNKPRTRVGIQERIVVRPGPRRPRIRCRTRIVVWVQRPRIFGRIEASPTPPVGALPILLQPAGPLAVGWRIERLSVVLGGRVEQQIRRAARPHLDGTASPGRPTGTAVARRWRLRGEGLLIGVPDLLFGP